MFIEDKIKYIFKISFIYYMIITIYLVISAVFIYYLNNSDIDFIDYIQNNVVIKLLVKNKFINFSFKLIWLKII